MTTALDIHGTCDARFSRVRDAFADNFARHGEVGAALSITVDGETVVDLWGGHADAARTRPWERDTIVNVFSTTKGMTALCANRLIDQGRLDPDAPVAAYWPEFARAGKEKITVRQVLSHQAGLPAVRELLPANYEWAPMIQALERTEPWWEPGTKHGYHAVTFGHLVGEIIRRITGMSVSAYFRKEVAEPLGVDFYIGFGPELDYRVAEMIPAPLGALPPEHPMSKVFTDPTSMNFKAFFINPKPMQDPLYMNKRDWRAAEIPAANGHTNARALARVYGALACGGEYHGYRLLSPEAIQRAREEQAYGEDAVLMIPTRWGLGFMLDNPELPLTPGARMFGHAGMGGSIGFADPEARVGFGYTMNKMLFSLELLDPRWRPLVDALYESL
jgi:CubicO group peptidase (beta-lactamase class C family)